MNIFKLIFIIFLINSPSLLAHEIFAKFLHKKHMSFFKKESIECTQCHAAHETTFKMKNQMLCHQCHVSEKYVNQAPQTCTTCHSNLKAIRPKNHTIKWIQGAHKDRAKTSDKLCISCHRTSFCIDCHKKRDDVRKRVHSRNFIFSHSIEMRRKPVSCNSCHTQNFCINCHRTRGIEK